MWGGVELHTLRTRLPPLRDISMNGQTCSWNFSVYFKVSNFSGKYFKAQFFYHVLYHHSLPMAAPDREQLKIELQQVNQQINQQTQMRSMEVCVDRM